VKLSASKKIQPLLGVVLIGVYLFFTVPNFLTSLYAEDGQVYLQDAFNTGGLNNLFKTVAGYGDLPARAIAAFVSPFPVVFYPYMYGVCTVLVMAVCVRVVYSCVEQVLENRILALYFSIFLVLMPIARFESIGNVTNLHFFFFTASTFVFIQFALLKTSSVGKLLFVFAASLSVPLSIFHFIFVFFRWRENLQFLRDPKRFFLTPFFFLLVGTMLNFIISWGDTSTRTPTNSNSILKILYLYLDRVVGSAFVPFWGRVSSQGDETVFSNSLFEGTYLRAVISIVILGALVVCTTRLKHKHRGIAFFVLFASILYSFLIGFFYNLEPRYCIFPSYVTTFLLFLYLDSLKIKRLNVYVGMFLLLLALNANSESESRKNAPVWVVQVKTASKACEADPAMKGVSIRTAPFRSNSQWFLVVPCSRLSSFSN